MLTFQVHCKNCVFAKLQSGVQVGCSVKNIDNFEKKYEENYYVIDRHCNSHRSSSWLKQNADHNPNEKVKEENKIKIGYAINFIGNYNEDEFRKTVKSLNNPSYVIVINDRVEHNKNLFNIMEQETKLHQSRLHVIQIINQSEKYYVDEAFKAARNGYFCYCKSGFSFPPNFYEVINNAINVDMKLVSVCIDENFILFQSALFNYLDGNKPRMLEDGSIDSSLFLEKIKNFQDHEKCVHEWSLLHEKN